MIIYPYFKLNINGFYYFLKRVVFGKLVLKIVFNEKKTQKKKKKCLNK